MTRQDRQKLGVFVVLVGVLVLTLVLGYRMNRPPTTAATQAPENKPSANPPTANDARIRLDLVEKPEAAEDEAGRKNLFQYRQAPPPPPAPRPDTPAAAPAPPPNMTSVPVQPRPAPPPPPPIPLKYMGFAAVNAPDRGLTAFLEDGSRHYNVKAGEVLMGRYRITRISDTSVEVEDLEYNRRQTLPLLK